MANRAFNRYADSPSRNKENRSPFTHRRARSSIPSLVKSPDNSEFFTESFLASSDASQKSFIPSPAKAVNPKNKRQHRPNANRIPKGGTSAGTATIKPTQRPSHRPTQSESYPSPRHYAQYAYGNSPARGNSPFQSNGIATPPRPNSAANLVSPHSSIASSPPVALTDTFTRIQAERDLAETEGDFSDPDSLPDVDGIPSSPMEPPSPTPAKSAALRVKPVSRGTTPVPNSKPVTIPQPRIDDDATIMSDPTGAFEFSGKSFWEGLSDANLAQKMTPVVAESALDKQKLREVWGNRRIQAFGKAGQIRMESPELPKTTLVQPSPNDARRRLVAFSKAGRVKLEGDSLAQLNRRRTLSDLRDRPDQAMLHDAANNGHVQSPPLTTDFLPPNPKVRRVPYFQKNHGFPARSQGSNESTEEKLLVDRTSPKIKPEAQQTVRVRKATTPEPAQAINERLSNLSLRTSLPKLTTLAKSREAKEEESPSIAADDADDPTSDIDWANDANGVLHSKSVNGLTRTQSVQSEKSYHSSPAKTRRLDFDFTGQSFQVSESPPVRVRTTSDDYVREREIKNLAQKAVTSSRLKEIHKRESLEQLRRTSLSPLPALTENAIDELNAASPVGERLAGTPVVVYRSSSVSSRRSSTPNTRPAFERSNSHDVLRKLSRGSGSTPRSSLPVIINDEKPKVAEKMQDAPKLEPADLDIKVNGISVSEKQEANEEATIVDIPILKYKQTPRVTGGWTDTILPDTVRTVKGGLTNLLHAPTPHVSAGGWIDTPLPGGVIKKLESVAESTQEIPEELMEGITKDTASVSTVRPDEKAAEVAPLTNASLAPSLTRKVLEQAKAKLEEHQAGLIVMGDDTLNLNNTTIESLEDVLRLDDDTLSKVIDEDTFTQLVDTLPEPKDEEDTINRIWYKLRRVHKTIHDAKVGISMLEHQISQDDETLTTSAPASACTTCGQPEATIGPSSSKTWLPLTTVTMSLPVPLLIKKKKVGSTSRLPGLTPLGWVTLSIWVWYVLECTFAEFFSHPRFAESYVWPEREEPDFPFVLPTMLWRWSQLENIVPLLIRPILTAVVAFYRMIGMSMGLIDGFADTGAMEDIMASEPVQQTVEAALNMMNDDYL